MNSLSDADAAAVNPNGIKTLLANGLSTFFIKDKPAFSNDSRCLPENPPYWPIPENWLFDDFMLADVPSAKSWQSLKIYMEN